MNVIALVRKDFAMTEELSWVIIHLQAGGFWTKWNKEMFDEKVQRVADHYLSSLLRWLQVFLQPEEEHHPEPLTMDHFAFAFSLYLIGISVSLVVYLAERFAFRCFAESDT